MGQAIGKPVVLQSKVSLPLGAMIYRISRQGMGLAVREDLGGARVESRTA